MSNQELYGVMDGTVENNNEEVIVEAGNSHKVKEEHDEEIGTEVAEKKWPGWPGENVFRIFVSQITHHMQVPLSYALVIIGVAGANISYICRASRAIISIQETKGIPGEITIEIFGSDTEVLTARQLVQNVIAEAASTPAPAQNWMGPADQDQFLTCLAMQDQILYCSPSLVHHCLAIGRFHFIEGGPVTRPFHLVNDRVGFRNIG